MTGSTMRIATTSRVALTMRARTTRMLECIVSARISLASAKLPAHSASSRVPRSQNADSSAVIRENFCLPIDRLMPSSASWIAGSKPVR